ncbi:AbgT family transporter [uncultured Fretibacterium sp.]|uniref:AbgT family transporter n=1 Tax=uncultured Fretibacterium sp. TaxID=1678694 RepID=UPI002602A3B4|nr:AbgT family transporter [uncultured Fretibacterium sp.]
MSESVTKVVPKRSGFEKFIRGVEVVGNKFPHPFWLFVLLSLLVMGLSAWFAQRGTSVTYLVAKAGEAPKETTVAVVSLLSYESMRAFLADFVKTYMNFAPLGLILTMMLGIGLVEQTGMISALMRKTILWAPRALVTAVIAIVGINANLASDAGIIFTPVIAAAVFKALGRNPWVGIAAGYAAASGGFTANLFVAGTDALLAGITKSAVEGVPGIPANVPVHPLINWYFMIAATFILTFLTVYVTERYTVRMLGDDEGGRDEEALKAHAVTPAENRGLFCALLALVAYIALIVWLTYPQGSLFRAPDGSLLPRSPLLSSVMPLLFFLFFFVGVAYGLGAGVIRKGEDIPKLMQKGIVGSTGFMVVVLPASFFVALFRMSRFDTVLSVNGAEWLKSMNLGGVPLLLLFIVLVTFLNLFMMSGSAKWLILAPIFVPMFAQVGFSPALTQLAYRIGDSTTNIVTPLSYYLPVIIGLLEQYKKESDPDVGIGTVISMAMPYTVFYILGFTALLIVWYLLGVPLGPGTPVSI